MFKVGQEVILIRTHVIALGTIAYIEVVGETNHGGLAIGQCAVTASTGYLAPTDSYESGVVCDFTELVPADSFWMAIYGREIK